MLTAEGRLMHERVHEEKRESRRDVRIEYGVPLRSLRLGIIGKADVIEFHRLEDNSWVPFPVEYKRGRKNRGRFYLSSFRGRPRLSLVFFS